MSMRARLATAAAALVTTAVLAGCGTPEPKIGAYLVMHLDGTHTVVCLLPGEVPSDFMPVGAYRMERMPNLDSECYP